MKVDLPVVLTPSRTELGIRCHRRHVLNDILQMNRYYSASLEFGTTCHSGIRAWWETGDLGKVHDVIRAEWAKRFIASKGLDEPNKVSVDLAITMMDRYVEQAGLAGPYTTLGPWKPVQIEERLQVKVGPYVLSFQVDRLLHNMERDHIVVVDYKTAGRLDARWNAQWEMSLQMKLYRYAVMKVYDRENVDIIVEGQEKSAKGTLRYAPCPEWDMSVLEEAVEVFKFIAGRDKELILSAMSEPGVVDMDRLAVLALTRTQPNFHDCSSYGVECQYRKLCAANPEERLGLMKAEYFEVQDSEY